MYVSRHLKIDDKIGFKKNKIRKIQQNKPLENYYLLCTSNEHLFEIIEGEHLNDRYESRFLLGISKEKEKLVAQVVTLVDELYNHKTIDYHMLKVQ